MTDNVERLELENGKYTLINTAGHLSALRYGEPWRDLLGDNLILALWGEVESMRQQLIEATAIPVCCQKFDTCEERCVPLVRYLRQQLAEQKRLTEQVYRAADPLKKNLAECQERCKLLKEDVDNCLEVNAECQAREKDANNALTVAYMSGFRDGKKDGKRKALPQEHQSSEKFGMDAEFYPKRVAELEQQLAESDESTLRLINTIKYLIGIAERGEGRAIAENETAELFVLGYVKQIEQHLAACQAREKVLRDSLIATRDMWIAHDFLPRADMQEALAMPSDSPVALNAAIKQAKREQAQQCFDRAFLKSNGSSVVGILVELQRMAEELK